MNNIVRDDFRDRFYSKKSKIILNKINGTRDLFFMQLCNHGNKLPYTPINLNFKEIGFTMAQLLNSVFFFLIFVHAIAN